MLTPASGSVKFIITTQPKLTEINVSNNNKNPVTIEPMLTPFDIAMFFRVYLIFTKKKLCLSLARRNSGFPNTGVVLICSILLLTLFIVTYKLGC